MDRSKNALPDQSKAIFVVPMSSKKKSYTDKKKCLFTNYLPPLIGASYGLKVENFGPPVQGVYRHNFDKLKTQNVLKLPITSFGMGHLKSWR